ncbi:phenylacetate--CoA ligase family protein [Lutibacter sp.]|uniref:phenylacetate--CoA ligase family protein n=1 Tax=Lutibacter sp. TaxID=1925666 RepID=UPI00273739DE|nr:hypothetical protein [Lutibacter sp.]MDP3312599.1 hypothetical protein [Lutibacter sp.]
MLTQIYTNSPVFFQNILITLYGYYWRNRRFGGFFGKKLIEFKERENFTAVEWTNYQTTALRKLLVHAFTTVPFYKALYKKHGFTIHDFETFELEDLQKLPFLEKEDLRKFGTSTLLSLKRKKGTFYSSSGSTGTPTELYFSREFHQTWSALYEARVRNWADVTYKMPRATIGGRRVVPKANSNPPYYRFNRAESQTYFSAYHISEVNVEDYVLGLITSNATYLVGYATSIYLLALCIEKKQLKAPPLMAVLTSSEKLTEAMRISIERVFNCKAFDGYSGVEACGLISENKFGELLFSPDSGIMEVLNDDNIPVNCGESGNVIATGLLNFDQPLIRYRIGDKVTLAVDQPKTGDNQMLKILEIEGREEDVIRGINGSQMVRFHGVFVGIPDLLMSQVIQHTLQYIEIKLVINANYKHISEKIMADRIKSQLGEMEIKFTYVESIEKTKNGKYKAVISHLKHE